MKMPLSKNKVQIVILYASTLLGILLGVLSSIVNTRFLDPNSYGDVRYVQNVICFVASLLLFGYFLSGSRLLALSGNEQYSKRVRGAMCVILSIACLVLVLSCFGCYIGHLNAPHIAYLFLISMPVCFYPLFLNYVNTTAQGDNHIGRLSVARFAPSLLYVPLAFIVYKTIGASSQLIILLQWGVYSAILLCVILSTKPSFKELRPVFRALKEENKTYGMQLYIGSIVMCATNYIAGITIGIFNPDNTEVGFYTLALTVTGPLATLPAIVGTTYFKQFASQKRIPDTVMKFSIGITIISCLVFIATIRPLVTLLYSEAYAPVGMYAMVLAIGFSIHGIGDMINRYLGSHGQGKSIKNASIANGLLKVFGYTVLVYYFSTIGALVTTLVCDFIYSLVLFRYYNNFVSKHYL